MFDEKPDAELTYSWRKNLNGLLSTIALRGQLHFSRQKNIFKQLKKFSVNCPKF